MIPMLGRMKTMRALLALSCLLLTTGPARADADEDFAAGVKAFQSADYPGAVKALTTSLAAKPSAKAALYLGNAYLKLGQLAPAKAALATVLRLEPNSPKKDAIRALIRTIDARNVTKLTVTTTPEGASVYLDTESAGARGKTPLTLAVPPGRHQIIVTLDGYDSETREDDFKSGESPALSIALHGKGCEVALTAKDLPNGRAAIDGAESIALPAKVRLTRGEHQVLFTSRGFEPKTMPASCDGVTPVAVEATLAAAIGRLAVPTVAGTIVAIDGKVVAMSADDAAKGIGLPTGRHEITITLPNRPPRTSVVEVGAGDSVPLPSEQPQDKVAAAAPAAPNPGYPPRGFYVSLQGGGNLVLRPWKLGTNAFQAQNGVDGAHAGSSGIAGVRLGYHVLARLAVEIEVDWVGLPNRLGASQGTSYELTALFHVLRGKWTPIVEGGAGAYQVVAGPLGQGVAGRAHLGVGFRGLLKDWLSVRIDARDVVSTGFESGGANNVELLAGLEAFISK